MRDLEVTEEGSSDEILKQRIQNLTVEIVHCFVVTATVLNHAFVFTTSLCIYTNNVIKKDSVFFFIIILNPKTKAFDFLTIVNTTKQSLSDSDTNM